MVKSHINTVFRLLNLCNLTVLNNFQRFPCQPIHRILGVEHIFVPPERVTDLQEEAAG